MTNAEEKTLVEILQGETECITGQAARIAEIGDRRIAELRAQLAEMKAKLAPESPRPTNSILETIDRACAAHKRAVVALYPEQLADTAEITTENVDKLPGYDPFKGDGTDDGVSMRRDPDGDWCAWEEARKAAIEDIRANQTRVAKPLRERIAKLEAQLDSKSKSADGWREKYTTYCHEYHEAARERDEARAELARLLSQARTVGAVTT